MRIEPMSSCEKSKSQCFAESRGFPTGTLVSSHLATMLCVVCCVLCVVFCVCFFVCFLFIYLALPTRAGSPQQHMPNTVGPFCLTHPVNFPFGRKPE